MRKQSSNQSGRLNRRRFLKATALTAVAASGPALLAAEDEAGLRRPILGKGDHTYECIHDWGKLPPSITYGNTHGVCQDSQGRVHIAHTVGAGSLKDDTIVVFDEDGRFVRSWGAEFKGGAHGLHINKEGREEFLYLCDYTRHLMVKTTLEGKDVFRLSVPMESGLYSSVEEYHPTNVATAPNGDFYVADGYGKSWIHQYSASAKYIRSFGGPGKERGQTLCSHGLMVDTRGPEPLLVVADRSNHRLQYFTFEGRPICFVTEGMRLPCHFHQHQGDLVVPDLMAEVTILDRTNKVIVHLGDGGTYKGLRDRPRTSFIPGKFIAPHSAYYDAEGNIFVVEWVEVGRVTKLRKIA